VEFYSVEYAQYFMDCYGRWDILVVRILCVFLVTAGSTSKGDGSSPQFIVDNRAVILEFARADIDGHRSGNDPTPDRDPSKADWICDRVRFASSAS
jgi:hypothetical protein